MLFWDRNRYWENSDNSAEPGDTLPLQTVLISEEANWSGSALFAIKNVNS